MSAPLSPDNQSEVERLLQLDLVSYDALLEKGRRWRDRYGQPEKAAALLAGLWGRYPLALELGQELALTQLEFDSKQAEQTLRRVEGLLRNPNEELLCRWGRLYKDRGDRLNPLLASAGQSPGPDRDAQRARQLYDLALKMYGRAYSQVRQGHYPGINMATLHLVCAALDHSMKDMVSSQQNQEAATSVAQALLDCRSQWPVDQPGDVTIWHPATEAEALVLLRKWSDAATLYHSIPAGKRDRDSMRKQVDRLLSSWKQLGEVDFGPLNNLDDVFANRN
jgi:DNA-binding Xre family transcriptional regulator